jgi:PEP-CTERM motif
MKTILLTAALLLSVGAVHAQSSLLLSDFSNFSDPSTIYYSQAFDGPWSETTALAGPTSLAIGDFGQGTPSGASGNGFIKWLGDTPQDWTAYSYINLTGFAPAANQTTYLRFYIEDTEFNTSASAWFNLADFATGPTTVSLPFAGGPVNLSQVDYWGFVVSDFMNAPEFAFVFDHATISASPIPEPSTYAAMAGGLSLLAALAARRRRRAAV